MLIWFLGFLFLALICLLGSMTRPYDTYVSPVTVFGLGAFLYVVAIPMEVAATGVPYLRLHAPIFIPESTALHAVLLAFVAYLAFFGGYWIALNKKRLMGASPRHPHGPRVAQRTLGAASLALVLLLALAFPSELAATRSYQAAYTERFENPLFAALSFAAALVVGMFAFILGRDRGRSIVWVLGLTFSLACWGIFSNQKTPLVFAGLAACSLLLRNTRNRPRPVAFIAAVFTAPLILGVSAVAFSLNRGGASIDVLGRVRQTGFLTGVEPAGPFYSLVVETLEPGSSGPDTWRGESFLQAFIGWVPRTVWPGRPLDLSLTFAQVHTPNWRPGQGFGFSPIAEGLLQGGLLGLGVFFFLVGTLIATARNIFAVLDHRREATSAIYEAFFFVGFIYLCFIFFRGPLQTFITGLMQGLIILLPLVLAAHVALQMSSRRHPGPNEAVEDRAPGVPAETHHP